MSNSTPNASEKARDGVRVVTLIDPDSDIEHDITTDRGGADISTGCGRMLSAHRWYKVRAGTHARCPACIRTASVRNLFALGTSR